MKLLQTLIISFLLIVNFICCASAQDITLSWDASPTSSVTGYLVYYKQGDSTLPLNGEDADQGISPIDVGEDLTATLTGLTDEATYYFSVTAYDYSNNQSSFSNIVSNDNPVNADPDLPPAANWSPALLRPANNATMEPVPVTFQWETDPDNYNVSYTLFYGTVEDELTGIIVPPPTTKLPTALFIFSITFLTILLYLLSRQHTQKAKVKRHATGFAIAIVFAGFLTACGGGGGGGGSSDSSTSNQSSDAATTTAPTLYSVSTDTSDYYYAYDLEAGTTYYWKVVATDREDPSITYTSEVHQFTTDTF